MQIFNNQARRCAGRAPGVRHEQGNIVKLFSKVSLGVVAAVAATAVTFSTASAAGALASSDPDFVSVFGKPLTRGTGTITKACYGKLVDEVHLRYGGAYTLKTYYSTANNGTLCSKLHNLTPRAHDMALQIQSVDAPRKSRAMDTGLFEQYAGAVSISNVNNRGCNFLDANVKYNGKPMKFLGYRTYTVKNGKVGFGC